LDSVDLDNPPITDTSEDEVEPRTAIAELNCTSLRNRASASSLTSTSETVEIKMDPLESDPFSLTNRKKSDEELRRVRPKKLHDFYKNQNDLIDELIAPIEDYDGEKEEKHNFRVKFAIYASVSANVVIFFVQIAAAVLSGSFALFATTADAFMDLLSSVILLVTSRLASKPDEYLYPSGKGRFEAVGIIIFGTLMATLSLQLIARVAESFFSKPESPELGILSSSFIAASFLAKLALFLYCRLIKAPSAQVLAQDHRNDLIFNSSGLILLILANKVHPLFDPIGAICIALIILHSWSCTVLEHCQQIVGKVADPVFLKRVTYIAMTHSPSILQVDTCRAYHAGSKLIVEVDIVLPPETMLQVAHDLGESLQEKLESLPNVDRAFVHCDHDSIHHPEHRKWL